MDHRAERALWALSLVVVIVSAIQCAADESAAVDRQALESTIRELGRVREHAARVHNESLDLSRLVGDLSDERDQLVIDLAAALARPAEVRTVTRTVTRLEAGPVIEVPATLDDMVQDYRIGGLLVGRFQRRAGVEHHATFGLDVRASVVVGDGESAGLVEARSSADPVWVELPAAVEVHTTDPRPHRVVALSAALGISAHVGAPLVGGRALVGASGALLLPWLHPHPNVDLLTPRINVSGSGVRGGVDAVGYNVGGPLSVVDDLWIYGGAGVGSSGSWSVDLTLATRI